MGEEPNRSEDGSGLPPGYRFFPTEEELLGFYLQNKLCNRREDMKRAIPLAHVYHFDPWQLPGISGERSVDDTEQWFFFCARQEREAHGGRPTRTTPSGYWKATGSPSFVYSSSGRPMGVKKTMVFYRGRAPTGDKTKWKMNEYRALEEGGATSSSNPTPKLRSEFSLCRVYIKSGCLRSFDRRPSDGAAAPAGTGGRMLDAAAPSDDENPPAAKRRRTHDCSSSDGRGDHGSPIGGEMDLKMLEGFEWDSLDWD